MIRKKLDEPCTKDMTQARLPHFWKELSF